MLQTPFISNCIFKTSLINVLMGRNFGMDCRPTLGVDFATRLVPGPDETAVKLQFWDFSGQDRFRILSRAYFKGAQGCFLVFDVNRRSSFDQLMQWERQLRDQDRSGECFTMVLANKASIASQSEAGKPETPSKKYSNVELPLIRMNFRMISKVA